MRNRKFDHYKRSLEENLGKGAKLNIVEGSSQQADIEVALHITAHD